MKIINEKGKLFGIINIIDLSILLIIGIILVGGISRMKTQPTIGSNKIDGIITFEAANIKMVTVDSINVGDPVFNYEKGTYIGEIIEVSQEPYKEYIDFNGEWVDAEVPEKYVVEYKVKSEMSDSSDALIVGGEQVRVGSQFRLKNKKATYFGTVLDIEVN